MSTNAPHEWMANISGLTIVDQLNRAEQLVLWCFRHRTHVPVHASFEVVAQLRRHCGLASLEKVVHTFECAYNAYMQFSRVTPVFSVPSCLQITSDENTLLCLAAATQTGFTPHAHAIAAAMSEDNAYRLVCAPMNAFVADLWNCDMRLRLDMSALAVTPRRPPLGKPELRSI